MKSGTVSLVSSYSNAGQGATDYMGDMETLANGNIFVGWGSQPYFSEYSKSGKLLLDAKFPGPDLSYRATLATWVGLPQYPPSGAARDGGPGTTDVYASWNGATEVTSWRALAGPSTKDLSIVATAARAGFETQLPVKGNPAVFEVQALGSKGQVVGTSKPFTEAPATS
jgi:hypothetical protein